MPGEAGPAVTAHGWGSGEAGPVVTAHGWGSGEAGPVVTAHGCCSGEAGPAVTALGCGLRRWFCVRTSFHQQRPRRSFGSFLSAARHQESPLSGFVGGRKHPLWATGADSCVYAFISSRTSPRLFSFLK